MMALKKIVLLLMLLTSLTLTAHAQEPPPLSDPVIIPLEGIIPEGVEYIPYEDVFITGSLSTGTIYRVGPEQEAESWIEDADLVSTVGIEVDLATNRLLVTNSDSSVFSGGESLASLAAYDFTTGERLFLTDLGGLLPDERHFANDVAVDAEGNAYVTDSLAPVIYKVDPEGNAEIFLQADEFEGGFLGLNGIDYQPDGYLLAAVLGEGTLYKIPLDDPSSFSLVEMEEAFGMDGIYYTAEGFLYAVSFSFSTGTQEIIALTSQDDWASAQIVQRVETSGEATTIAVRNGQAFYINAYIDNSRQKEYQIVPIEFEYPS